LSPGVYSFLDEDDKVLYVGKAKNLKNRVTSYSKYKQLLPRTQKLVTTATKLEYRELDSELTALLVEAELIRTYQPLFNILLKDDKSPIYLIITKEEFPRILKKRKRELQIKKHNYEIDKATVLGPFSSTYRLNEVLKIARKIFPWCNQSRKINKPCFYRHIDLCPGVCTNEIVKEKYQEQIKQLTLFLRGKKKTVLKSIKKSMKEAALIEDYEQAQHYKKQIEIITEVTSPKYSMKPELILPTFNESQVEAGLLHLRRILTSFLPLPNDYPLERIEGYDVSNIQGTSPAVSMVVAKDGLADNKEYKHFNIKSLDTPNDYHMLKEALTRRQTHPEWGMPNLVVIDGGKGQVRGVLSIWNWDIPVIGIAKGPDRLVIPIIHKDDSKKISYEIVKLPENHPTLKIIQQLFRYLMKKTILMN